MTLSRTPSLVPMGDVQRRFCVKITKRIARLPIASSFLSPVDPAVDGAPGYFEMIKKPMDLGTALGDLTEGRYVTLERWKEDVNLIWKNAMAYNNAATPIYTVARELNEHFKRSCESIPRTNLEAWTARVAKRHAALIRLLEGKPDPSVNVPPRPDSRPKPARQTKILLRQKSNPAVAAPLT